MDVSNSGQEALRLFLADRSKQVKTASLVWLCMLPLAGICILQKIVFGYILMLFAIILGMINLLSYRKLKAPEASLEDPEEFYREMAGISLYTDDGKRFKILPHYVVFSAPEVKILPLAKMAKLEVGLQGSVKKTLFLTDSSGVRNQVMSTSKGDGRQEDFDCVYRLLKDLLEKNQGT